MSPAGWACDQQVNRSLAEVPDGRQSDETVPWRCCQTSLGETALPLPHTQHQSPRCLCGQADRARTTSTSTLPSSACTTPATPGGSARAGEYLLTPPNQAGMAKEMGAVGVGQTPTARAVVWPGRRPDGSSSSKRSSARRPRAQTLMTRAGRPAGATAASSPARHALSAAPG